MRKWLIPCFTIKIAATLRWLVATYLLLISVTANGQSAIPSTVIEKTKNQYLRVESMGDSLFAITDDGDLVIWNLAKFDTVGTGIGRDSAYHFSAITRAGNGLWLGCADGKIYSYRIPARFLNLRYQCKGPVYAIAVNSLKEIWIANEEGVYNPETHISWDQFSNHPDGRVVKQKKGSKWIRLRSYYASPQIDYLDSKNRWWLAARYGEFGGDLEIFNTETKKIISSHFDSLNINLFFPQSISEIPLKGILLSSGLQHFDNFGELLLIDRNYHFVRLFNSQKLFVGPSAYNPMDSCIYFSSGQGIHKARVLKDGKLTDPVLLFETRLESVQEQKAIGQAMPVKQLLFYSPWSGLSHGI